MAVPVLAPIVGAQEPRLRSVPPYVSSAGPEAVELAAAAGLTLDPWQQLVLRDGLGEQPDGRWAAFEVCLIVSRQNGKGAILEARELAGLFLFGEQLILHSAHEFKTASEAFRRLLFLIDGSDDLRRRVLRVRTSHGEEGIELRTGQRLRFVARSTASGRGFSGDTVILDEAFRLDARAMEALLPTLSARPNPQLWYASSAGSQESTQLAAVRQRGLDGTDPALAFFEWSIDPDHDDPADPASWARANPALGRRISLDHVARERAALGAESFAKERLGLGGYPVDGVEQWQVISQAAWAACLDDRSTAVDPVAFGVDVTPDRSMASVAAAGRRRDGLAHVEVVDHRPGTGWVVQRCVSLRDRWQPCAIVVDPRSPASSLLPRLAAAGVEVVEPTARDIGAACGELYDAVAGAALRHRGQPELTAALAGARRRDLGGVWAWARTGLTVDLSPLVAVTLALWGHTTRSTSEGEFFAAWR